MWIWIWCRTKNELWLLHFEDEMFYGCVFNCLLNRLVRALCCKSAWQELYWAVACSSVICWFCSNSNPYIINPEHENITDYSWFWKSLMICTGSQPWQIMLMDFCSFTMIFFFNLTPGCIHFVFSEKNICVWLWV